MLGKALMKLMRIFIDLCLMLFGRVQSAHDRTDNQAGTAQRTAHAAAAADTAAHARHHADCHILQAQL